MPTKAFIGIILFLLDCKIFANHFFAPRYHLFRAVSFIIVAVIGSAASSLATSIGLNKITKKTGNKSVKVSMSTVVFEKFNRTAIKWLIALVLFSLTPSPHPTHTSHKLC